jgi:NTP pyrophosphatase (non-canonical NTP hydrolase)
MSSVSVSATFLQDLQNVQRLCYQNSKDHGFWDGAENDNIPTKLCLIHSEISEALEAHRKGNPPSEKCPGHSHFAEELADAVIRILDLAGRLEIDIGTVLVQKMAVDAKRSHMHGGKVC